MNKRRAKGKSHSMRPSRTGSPKWIRLSYDEIADIVEQLYKNGYGPSMIGVILRDQYGIPLVKQVMGKSVTDLLTEKGIKQEIPEDLAMLIRRAVNVRRHTSEHPRDSKSKKGLEEIESKIRRLERYYKRVGKLSPSWVYDPEKAKLSVTT